MKIALSGTHYNCQQKCEISTISLLRTQQIMQFHTCSVDFFGSRHSCPNGSATSLLIPLEFSTKYAQCAVFAVNICIQQPSPPSGRQPGRPPASPGSPPASRSARQMVPRVTGIIAGNANGVRNRSTLRTDLAPPTSSCRGGMGEAQGDPQRHFRRSTRRGERMPNGSVRQLQYSFCGAPSPENARGAYRTPSTRIRRTSKIIG